MLIVLSHIYSSNSFMNLLLVWMSCSQKNRYSIPRTWELNNSCFCLLISRTRFGHQAVIISPVLTAHYCHSSTVWVKSIVHVDLSTSTFFFPQYFYPLAIILRGLWLRLKTGTACVCLTVLVIHQFWWHISYIYCFNLLFLYFSTWCIWAHIILLSLFFRRLCGPFAVFHHSLCSPKHGIHQIMDRFNGNTH